MTPKQQMFCDEYLVDLNATRAYKAVYKNCKSDAAAAVCASKLLRNPKVEAYIAQRMAAKEDALIAKQDEVLKYLTAVLRGESEAEIVVVEGTGDGCSSARQVVKAPDEKERLKAAELLAKRYGLLTDRVESTGDITLNISVDYGDKADES